MAESFWIDPDVEMQALAEADARRRTVMSTRDSLPDDAGERAVELVRRNPNLSAGLLQALVAGQVPDAEADALAQQDDGGFFGSVFDVAGDIIETVTEGAEHALDKVYNYAIQPALRGVFLASETMFEEGIARPIASAVAAEGNLLTNPGAFRQAYEDYGDSVGRNLLQGDFERGTEEGALGRGIVPAGAAAAETQSERQLEIRGQQANIGQAIAQGTVGAFYGPGDRAYDLVAGIGGFAAEVALDPLAWATLGGSKIVTAARTLDRAAAIKAMQYGAVEGARRNTALIDVASNLGLNGKVAQRLADADAYDIMQKWSQSPANRLDIEAINRLGATKNVDEVAEVWMDLVARGDINRKGFYSGMGNFIKRNLVESTSKFAGPFRYFTPEGKLSGISPRGIVSADDVGEAAGKVDSLLRQANIERDVRAGIFNRMAAITPGRFDELFDVVTDAMDEVAKTVGDDASLNDVAKAYRDELTDLRMFGTDDWANPLDVPYAKTKIVQNFDGTTETVQVPTPQALVELNSLSLTLPDATTIRRAATDNALLRKVYTSKGWDVTADSTRFITRNLFKPLAILRPAYIVRIGAENQARLVGAHHDSLLSHPGRFIAANILNRNALKDLAGNSLPDYARATDIITKDAMGMVADRTRSQGRIFTAASRVEGEDLSVQFVKGWQAELGQISASPELRQMAFFRGDLGKFKEWAQTEGRETFERLSKTNDEAAELMQFGKMFDQAAESMKKRVAAKTANFDEDLVDRIVNQDIPLPGKIKFRNGEIVGDTSQAAFANVLRAKARAGRAPARVKAELVEENKVKHLNTFVNGLFDWITGKPDSWAARYPQFRQAMLTRTSDLMDTLATDELREQAFAAAVTNLGADVGNIVRETPQMKALRKAFDNAKGSQGPVTSLDDFNKIVRSKADQDVKDLLFDVTRRGAAQDALEVVVPFLDAWKEVTRTWMRLMKSNPAFFVRAQAGYRELQDQGVFHVNEFGDEVFNMPGGGALSAFVQRLNDSGGQVGDIPGAALGAMADAVTGNTPDFGAPMKGRVEGLNLVAQGVGPGFGPVVQWAAGTFKSPDLDGLRKFIAPFGTGSIDTPGDLTDPGFLGDLAPAWMRKLINAARDGAIDERQWNSTVGSAIGTLSTSGDYGPNEQDRLREDAERFATWMLVARSFVQFAGPTGPSISPEVELDEVDISHPDWNPEIDPTGTMFGVGVLASDYHRLLRTYGPEIAAEKFYGMYGVEPFFIAQAKSRSLKELPVDTEGDRWARRNKDLVEDFPTVVGFFAPTDEDAELDFSVYAAQFDRGDRQSLTPREQIASASQVRARAMYQTVKNKVEGLPPAQRDRMLEITKGRLEEMFPGWQAPVLGLAQTARMGDKINDLKRAVEDPRLADNPTVKPLAAYLQMREMVLAEANARGLKTLSSDKVADLRERLHKAGEIIQQRYPAFIGVWTGVLSREVE